MPSGDVFAFGPFQLDTKSRSLTRDGELVTLTSRQFDLLHLFVARAGHLLSKDVLIEAAWQDVAVTDNSLEQAISSLRRILSPPSGQPYIETQARRGYRFAAEVTKVEHRETDESLAALLAPHRAWIEGRAALETLERDHIHRARAAFEAVLAHASSQGSAHIGLANACAMQFEMTRTESPDPALLERALHHAREACRLDAQSGEAWATLGFVLDRLGRNDDAVAASRRAVVLEPDNWRHRFRLAYAGWGEERLREARRALTLLPGFPLAHWLAASVHVARQALGEAERELHVGLESMAPGIAAPSRFSSVALHWLLGLIRLSRNDYDGARAAFDLELAREGSGQLYARECCANTWYAIGALEWRRERIPQAHAAFEESLQRLPMHPMAKIALEAIDGRRETSGADHERGGVVDRAIARAARLVVARPADGESEAAALVEQALADAPPGNAGWLLPLEPLLNVAHGTGVWAPALARLRNRAA